MPTATADRSFGPGRSPAGRVRNFSAMTDRNLRNTIAELIKFGDDAEAMQAAYDAAITRRWKPREEQEPVTDRIPTPTVRTTYDVIVNSALEDGEVAFSTVLHTPLHDAPLAFAIGTDDPCAQEIADYYAGEYCDSGTILAVNRAFPADRAYVRRRAIA